jgi:hypothetical protein
MAENSAPEIVRASGFGVVCDHRFTDEVVARYPSASVPGGHAYVELRHLSANAAIRRRVLPTFRS